MKEVMGLIHHIKDEKAFRQITKNRCVAAIHFGGKYRLVDFPLSNMVNAGICNIGIVTSFNMRSLVDHLGRGEDWGLDRKQDGLFILPAASTDHTENKRRMDLEDIYANMDYLDNCRQEYVLISGSNIICNIDLREVLAFHKKKEADITIVYKQGYRFLEADTARGTYLQADKEQRITAVTLGVPAAGSLVSMDIYLLKKSLLLTCLKECLKTGKWDFVGDVLAARTKQLKIYGYAHQGYLGIINSWQSLFRHQMDLLDKDVVQELFFSKGMIYTKTKDGPPARYCEESQIRNALASNGCIIEGNVENSILFRKVKIGHGAVVRNSILMPKVEIDEDVVLDKVIIDKGVHVHKGTKLVSLCQEPIIIPKNKEIREGFV